MKSVSKKRAKLMREVRQERMGFIAEKPYCFACQATFLPDLCVHEIARGSHRGQAVSQRVAWLVLCKYCNCGDVNRYDVYPLARQYLLKKYHDSAHYDRVALNRMRGRADDAISEEEVMAWADSKGRPI